MDMFGMVGTALGAGVSLVTGGFGYILARRKSSGRVATTDADALWKEAGDMRRGYQRDIIQLTEQLQEKGREVEVIQARLGRMDDALARKDKRITDLEARLTEFRAGLLARDAQIAHLEAEVNELRDALAGRDAQIATLKSENGLLELRVRELEQELIARLAAARTATNGHPLEGPA